mmetsp:Transcript_20813/g.54065  ORF Transcript_20813/g.54065 Transcript_20813/m.54065 type:complete len:260 (+) Transcript_20813:1492-2271(+)
MRTRQTMPMATASHVAISPPSMRSLPASRSSSSSSSCCRSSVAFSSSSWIPLSCASSLTRTPAWSPSLSSTVSLAQCSSTVTSRLRRPLWRLGSQRTLVTSLGKSVPSTAAIQTVSQPWSPQQTRLRTHRPPVPCRTARHHHRRRLTVSSRSSMVSHSMVTRSSSTASQHTRRLLTQGTLVQPGRTKTPCQVTPASTQTLASRFPRTETMDAAEQVASPPIHTPPTDIPSAVLASAQYIHSRALRLSSIAGNSMFSSCT